VLLAGWKFVLEIKLTVFPQRLVFDFRWQQAKALIKRNLSTWSYPLGILSFTEKKMRINLFWSSFTALKQKEP